MRIDPRIRRKRDLLPLASELFLQRPKVRQRLPRLTQPAQMQPRLLCDWHPIDMIQRAIVFQCVCGQDCCGNDKAEKHEESLFHQGCVSHICEVSVQFLSSRCGRIVL